MCVPNLFIVTTKYCEFKTLHSRNRCFTLKRGPWLWLIRMMSQASKTKQKILKYNILSIHRGQNGSERYNKPIKIKWLWQPANNGGDDNSESLLSRHAWDVRTEPSACNTGSPSYTDYKFNLHTYIVCQLKVLLACQLIVHSFNQLQDLQERKGRRYLHCCIVTPQIKQYSKFIEDLSTIYVVAVL